MFNLSFPRRRESTSAAMDFRLRGKDEIVLMNIFNFFFKIAKICLQPAYLFPMLLLFSYQNARADVYGFIDEKGVAHFAAERVDARYELFFKGGESFDTQQGVTAKNAANNGSMGAVSGNSTPDSATILAAKDKANSKIQAYFDVSPSFKAVRHHMRDAAKTYNVDFELLQAMIVAESGFDHLAVSPKGAIGLMQLMPDTAKRFGVNADKSKSVELKLRDPKTNINAGAKYLRTLINMFPGKLELAIASYNAGEGAVQKYGNKIPPYKETQNYVSTVIQTYLALKPPVVITSLRNATAAENAPNRVRMQMGGAVIGGAAGRGNMVSPIASADPVTVQN
jgi:soluble lytic murein transglycosylase-like protein